MAKQDEGQNGMPMKSPSPNLVLTMFIAVTQVITVICLVWDNPAFKHWFGLLLLEGAAQSLYYYDHHREWGFLMTAAVLGIVGAGVLLWAFTG